jgi:hypothetical protein
VNLCVPSERLVEASPWRIKVVSFAGEECAFEAGGRRTVVVVADSALFKEGKVVAEISSETANADCTSVWPLVATSRPRLVLVFIVLISRFS